ncbi:FMN-binding negative transcriptional regulator [Azohydromonas lata]|uniref:FMN-binding negative transcriptional regulator n=1 Tax=Azohydromonas lata TaxID=45677 RepID=UPI00083278F4|nr:FMN-binding negative transcriptional regulator [Azohydromonas lata]
MSRSLYQPSHGFFQQQDAATLHALMRAHPLATLVHVGPHGPVADVVPLEFVADAGEHGTLRGHVPRANPVWQQAQGQEVLVLFHGPQGYVSPGWYATKAEHGKVVPTWNYAVVQARGPLRAIEDAAWLRTELGRLTAHHEAAVGGHWALEDAPADFTDKLLGVIVGIEIPVASLEGKFKLSQNQPAVNRDGVEAGLEAQGAPAAALLERMRATR